ncbi:hypothetical protein OROGR_020282 [Orobanche gracilis]
MGRGKGKLKMDFIINKKSRKLTFHRRRQCLIKKLQELTTLCDVKACMIIISEDDDNENVWPRNNPEEIRRVIDLYRAKKVHHNLIKTCGLSDFHNNNNNNNNNDDDDDDVMMIQTCNEKKKEIKYPVRDYGFLNFMTQGQLRHFAAGLNNKAQIVRSRIQFLKREKELKESMDMIMDYELIDGLFNAPPPPPPSRPPPSPPPSGFFYTDASLNNEYGHHMMHDNSMYQDSTAMMMMIPDAADGCHDHEYYQQLLYEGWSAGGPDFQGGFYTQPPPVMVVPPQVMLFDGGEEEGILQYLI